MGPTPGPRTASRKREMKDLRSSGVTSRSLARRETRLRVYVLILNPLKVIFIILNVFFIYINLFIIIPSKSSKSPSKSSKSPSKSSKSPSKSPQSPQSPPQSPQSPPQSPQTPPQSPLKVLAEALPNVILLIRSTVDPY